jgi:hypothetical protein
MGCVGHGGGVGNRARATIVLMRATHQERRKVGHTIAGGGVPERVRSGRSHPHVRLQVHRVRH